MPSQPASTQSPLPKPAVVPAASLDRGEHRSFLADVVIDHGPRDILNRMFLAADTQLRAAGVRLTFGSLEELIAVNRENRANWSPLLPLFDPELNDIDEKDAFILFARTPSGKVAATVGARRYDLADGTLADKIESLKLFYSDPAKSALEGEEIRVSSPVARGTRGTAVFSGAAWSHPDWRGARLIDPMAPIGRGVSLTKWYPDLTFSFMVPELVKNGTAKRWRMNVDWEITMINTPVKRGGTINAALSWTNPTFMEQHFVDVVASRPGRADAQVDVGVVQRTAEQ
ncbi:MAG: hypothetical protein AB7E81_23280 [Hyphomicrobiaceae bacterium]